VRAPVQLSAGAIAASAVPERRGNGRELAWVAAGAAEADGVLTRMREPDGQVGGVPFGGPARFAVPTARRDERGERGERGARDRCS
jgi:hypothetical protein